ncbi:hypothetical protein [Nocardia sp. R7R-8]|uniref:hypothetical protein n=1 Tax=Nocardia sp. R7R-8 TaxID=3459304 RepID=UPI00403DA42D
MIAPGDPGTQLPLQIERDDSPPEINVQEMRALLEGLKQWDGTTSQAEPAGDGEQQDIRSLMDESMAAFAELGIRVEYRPRPR